MGVAAEALTRSSGIIWFSPSSVIGLKFTQFMSHPWRENWALSWEESQRWSVLNLLGEPQDRHGSLKLFYYFITTCFFLWLLFGEAANRPQREWRYTGSRGAHREGRLWRWGGGQTEGAGLQERWLCLYQPWCLNTVKVTWQKTSFFCHLVYSRCHCFQPKLCSGSLISNK